MVSQRLHTLYMAAGRRRRQLETLSQKKHQDGEAVCFSNYLIANRKQKCAFVFKTLIIVKLLQLTIFETFATSHNV